MFSVAANFLNPIFRSFMDKLKSPGPRTDPWYTLIFTILFFLVLDQFLIHEEDLHSSPPHPTLLFSQHPLFGTESPPVVSFPSGLPAMSQANGSNPLDNSTLEMLRSRMLQITLPVLFSIIFSISIPLNSISFWFLCRNSRPWTPIIVFSINLTISDLLYSMLLPFQINYHLRKNDWIFGDFLCHAITILFYGNMYCSLLTMTGISIERYLGIVHPLRYKVMRPIRTSVFTCIVIWILVLLPLIPLMQNKLTRPVEELNITTCFDVLPKDMFPETPHFIAYFGSMVLFFFLLPLFIMGFCYISIIQTLLHSSPPHLTESKKQTVYLLIVLLLLLFFCYMPHILVSLIHYILVLKEKSAYVEYKLAIAIQSFNCCFDPLVYYFGSKEFRRKVQRKLCRCVPLGLSDHTPIFSEHNVQIMPKPKDPNK